MARTWRNSSLARGYVVHGMKRRSSSFNTSRVDHLYRDPHFLHYGDLTDATNLIRLLQAIQPTEIYNLGAQSHVQVSFETPEYTANADALGTLRLLEAIRILDMGKRTRFYQASTAEMFGGTSGTPQRETTPFHPRSPYAAAKVYAYWSTVNYREAHGLFAANGLLFNHESPRRGETFVTRKITRAVARIYAGLQKKLYMGNLDAKRDWGYAPEYAEGMWRILQQDKPMDYVLGTGEAHSVREFLDEAFGYVDLDWKNYVEMEPRYLRPSEVDYLLADADRARRELGWEPKIKFKELVRIMVDADLEAIGVAHKGDGSRILRQRFGDWHQWSDSVSKVLASVPGTAQVE